MARQRWTQEQKANALALLEEVGLAETHARTGVPKPTLVRWADEEAERNGMERTERTERQVAKTSAATQVVLVNLAQRRAVFAERLHEEAERQFAALHSPAKLYHWGTETDYENGKPVGSRTVFMEQEVPEPPFADQKTIMTTLAIALDKSLKLTGDGDVRDEPESRAAAVLRRAMEALPPDQRRIVARRIEEIEVSEVAS